MTRPTPEMLAHRAHSGHSAQSAHPPAPTPAAPKVVRTEETLTGAEILVRSLEEIGADVVFGIPGGAILPAYDPLYDSQNVRHILVRHEQGAGHAATGYAQATGRVGDDHAQVSQVHVPRHELGEAVGHGDNRFPEVTVGHAGRPPQRAGTGHVAA